MVASGNLTGTGNSNAEQVMIEMRGPTLILRFTNPPDGFISNKGASGILRSLTDALRDKAVRAIVITGGQPGVFIRHAEVSQISRAAEALCDGRIQPSSFAEGPFPALGHLIENAEKPVIAAIDGACMGGGFELALACTMRVASPGVEMIGLPEIRLGIFPGAGGTQRLPRLLGWHRARLFMLLGTVVDASQALKLGLVDELAASALDRAVQLAETLAQRPEGAVAAILRLTRDMPGRRFEDEAIAFAELLRDDPHVRERLRRFVEQRERLHEIQ